uniref:Uncharacterized protein n=1 Tax=Cacopsylla melanoneura TaxID=428564 RepID=A0A8D8WQR7_9HEMI
MMSNELDVLLRAFTQQGDVWLTLYRCVQLITSHVSDPVTRSVQFLDQLYLNNEERVKQDDVDWERMEQFQESETIKNGRLLLDFSRTLYNGNIGSRSYAPHRFLWLLF